MGPSREDVRTLNIIIVGDGKVGYTLAEHLSREEHNVTIVDTSEEALRKADESLDVMCIKGNGASITALREAGADTADLLIAATSMDEINMVCCLLMTASLYYFVRMMSMLKAFRSRHPNLRLII